MAVTQVVVKEMRQGVCSNCASEEFKIYRSVDYRHMDIICSKCKYGNGSFDLTEEQVSELADPKYRIKYH